MARTGRDIPPVAWAGQCRERRQCAASMNDASVGVDPRPSRAPDPRRERRLEVGRRQGRPVRLRRRPRPAVPSSRIRARAHDDDACERLGHEPHVVADRDDRPPRAVRSGDHPLDAGHAAGVLTGRRLVEDDDRRVHGEDRRQRQQLAPRVPEVVRVRVGQLASARRPPAPRPPRPAASAAERPRIRGPNSTSARTLPAKICRSGFWKTMPTRAARAATRSSAMSAPSCRTRPSVGRSRPSRWRTSVDLPLPFWPTIATQLAGPDGQVDAVERARAVRVDEPDALERERGHATDPSRADERRVEAARGQRTRQPDARRRLHAPALEPRVGEHLARPARRATIRPGVDDRRPGRTARRAGRSCARRSGARSRSPPASRGLRRPGASPPDRAGRSARRGPGGPGASPAARR